MATTNHDGPSELALLTKLGHELDKAPIEQTAELRRGMDLPDQVKTRLGVVLALKKVPGQVVTEATRKLIAPQPPTFHDEERNRDFTNEQDPNYLTALTDWHYSRIIMSNLAYLGLGTSLVSTPEGVMGPDDDWEGPLAELGLELDIPDKGTRKRYVAWLLNHVLDDAERQTIIDLVIGNYGEVREEAVAAAMDSFRSALTRPADNGVTAPTIQS
jgi:hypothetical protein